jgi:hypothetical protein
MRVLRLLAVPLLASIWVAPAVAQSGVAQSAQSQQDYSPLATPPLLFSQPLPASQRFSLSPGTVPSLFAPSPAGTTLNQAIPPLHLRRYSQFPSGQDTNILFQLARAQRTVTMAQNDVCYTVREYTFTRDNPASDATTMKDYSACRPANNFHLKGAAPMR